MENANLHFSFRKENSQHKELCFDYFTPDFALTARNWILWLAKVWLAGFYKVTCPRASTASKSVSTLLFIQGRGQQNDTLVWQYTSLFSFSVSQCFPLNLIPILRLSYISKLSTRTRALPQSPCHSLFISPSSRIDIWVPWWVSQDKHTHTHRSTHKKCVHLCCQVCSPRWRWPQTAECCVLSVGVTMKKMLQTFIFSSVIRAATVIAYSNFSAWEWHSAGEVTFNFAVTSLKFEIKVEFVEFKTIHKNISIFCLFVYLFWRDVWRRFLSQWKCAGWWMSATTSLIFFLPSISPEQILYTPWCVRR